MFGMENNHLLQTQFGEYCRIDTIQTMLRVKKLYSHSFFLFVIIILIFLSLSSVPTVNENASCHYSSFFTSFIIPLQAHKNILLTRDTTYTNYIPRLLFLLQTFFSYTDYNLYIIFNHFTQKLIQFLFISFSAPCSFPQQNESHLFTTQKNHAKFFGYHNRTGKLKKNEIVHKNNLVLVILILPYYRHKSPSLQLQRQTFFYLSIAYLL